MEPRIFLLNVWKLCCRVGDIEGAQRAFTQLYPKNKGYKPRSDNGLWE